MTILCPTAHQTCGSAPQATLVSLVSLAPSQVVFLVYQSPKIFNDVLFGFLFSSGSLFLRGSNVAMARRGESSASRVKGKGKVEDLMKELTLQEEDLDEVIFEEKDAPTD